VAARVLDESDVSHFPISRGLMGVEYTKRVVMQHVTCSLFLLELSTR
jgi:hypothetical protein